MPTLLQPDPHAADNGGVGLSANSFAEIYGQHMPEITRYCRSILRNRDDAEDAAQNAMERALKALSDGPPPDRMRPWLFTIAHRESINVLRRRRSADVALDDAAPAAPGSIEELSAVRERLAELLADLRELAPRQREGLVARELGGRSYRDIARDLGTSEAAAQQVVLEARQSLRQFEAGRSLECHDVQGWISAHDHTRIRTRRVRAHLRACGGCRGFEQGIHGRRRDFGLLLPGIGGGGSLWGGLLALLGQGGAKLAAAGAVVAAGAAVAVAPAPSEIAPPQRESASVARAIALAATTPEAATEKRASRSRPSERSAALKRRERRAVARVGGGTGAARRAGSRSPSAAPGPPRLGGREVQASDADRARAPEAADPQPTATAPVSPTPQPPPASTPAPDPVREVVQPVRQVVQPVLDAVPPVADAVKQAVEDVTSVLPERAKSLARLP